MADDEHKIGSRVSSAEIGKELSVAQGQMMFPAYNPSHITDYVKVQLDDQCIRERTIHFLVDFAVVGTDLGSAKELLSLAGSVVQVNPGTLTPSTVITVAGKVIDTLDDLTSKRDGKGNYRFSFPVHLCCHRKYQPFLVKLEVEGILQIQDKSEHDFVEIYLTLIANNVTDHRHLLINGSELGPGRTRNFSEIDALKDPLVCGFITDGDFEVVVIINEECHVDYDPFHPSIAAVRIQNLKIVITTDAECKEGKAPPLEITPKQQSPKAPLRPEAKGTSGEEPSEKKESPKPEDKKSSKSPASVEGQ